MEYGARAVAEMASAQRPHEVTVTEVGMLLCAAFVGDWERARMHGERARAAARALDDAGMASFACGFLAWVCGESGDIERGLAFGNEAIACGPTIYFAGWAGAFTAAVGCRGAQPEAALLTLADTTTTLRASGHVSGYALIALLLVEARLAAGELVVAKAEAQALKSLADGMPYPYVAHGARVVEAEVARRSGDEHTARALFEQAHAGYVAMGARDRAERVRARLSAAV